MRALALAETVAVAVMGVTLAKAVHAPAAALIGAMVATAIAALAGRPMVLPEPLRKAGLFMLGLAIGAAATPETLRTAIHWPLSLLCLLAATAAMTWAAYASYRHFAKWDKPTAFFAAVPGALSTVLAVGAERGADMQRVAVAQSIRVVILAALAPLLIPALGMVKPHVLSHTAETPLMWAALLLGCLMAAFGAQRLKWPAPWLLGPFLASLLLHGSGVSHATVTGVGLDMAYGVLGVMAGARFAGSHVRDVARTAPFAILSLFLAAMVGLVLGALAGWLAHVGPAAGVLAFAPGGLEIMTALALLLHVSPAYVAIHHLVRFLAVNLALPLIAPRLTAAAPADAPPPHRQP